ncbi:MAG: hypothetical protein H6797_02640 [Candidatus Nomurabacteria bacterium]|nr:MAG: hypothetical protein H6797_02640 [Candidatus Nomurabacteria bacterium]
MANKSKPHNQFENNPFFIASNGISLLANRAQPIFILFIILSTLNLFTNSISPDPTKYSFDAVSSTIRAWSINEWIFTIESFAIIGLAVVMVSALFNGVASYTSAQLARGHKVSLQVAFRNAFENLWPYLWLQVIIFTKLLLWTLLFIVPGIIMSIRYSLAGVAFYDEKKNLRGNAAIKESIRMTKNGWITTYASNALLNILTLGVVSSIVSTGVNATLYKQFESVGNKKPQAHWLSWLTLALPFILLLALSTLVIVAALVVSILGTPSR